MNGYVSSITLIVIALLTAFSAYMDRLGRVRDEKHRRQVKEAAESADARQARQLSEVKVAIINNADKANSTLRAIANVVDNTHTLVNSQKGVMLQALMISAQKLAAYTHNPEHIKIAEDAENEFADYESKQREMDKTQALPALDSLK